MRSVKLRGRLLHGRDESPRLVLLIYVAPSIMGGGRDRCPGFIGQLPPAASVSRRSGAEGSPVLWKSWVAEPTVCYEDASGLEVAGCSVIACDAFLRAVDRPSTFRTRLAM